MDLLLVGWKRNRKKNNQDDKTTETFVDMQKGLFYNLAPLTTGFSSTKW